MKNLFNLIDSSISLVFIILVFSLSGLTAQTYSANNSSFESTYKRSESIFTSNSFEFHSYMVFNGSQREKNASKLVVNNNKISGQLLPMVSSNASAITFKGKRIKNYKIQLDDEFQTIIIVFDTQIEGAKYHFTIKAMPNGKTFLEVNSELQENELEYIGNILRI
ncbi:DUF4251 domain-containing protein [Winogradskyella sp. A2]|uniref:DUF4251 domain-containing protein n=1 Tax=Winogradskyella sp. A2 TaxID=3366944 RepID=UPI00398C262E